MDSLDPGFGFGGWCSCCCWKKKERGRVGLVLGTGKDKVCYSSRRLDLVVVVPSESEVAGGASDAMGVVGSDVKEVVNSGETRKG